MHLFFVALVVAAEPAAPPRAAECTADAQCTITTFSGCCGGCCPQARAMSRAELERQQKRCAVIDCEAPMCAAVVCEPGPSADSLEARCSAGRCVARPKQSGPAECRADRDCTIVYPSPGPNDACRTSACGCCPGTQPVAQPVAKVELEDRRLPAPERSNAAPAQSPQPFGLSQGNTAGPQRPQCSPCPAPIPARAVCQQSRCAVVLTPGVRR